MVKGIVIDTKQIDLLANELKGFEKEVGVAAYHALNRTLTQMVTQAGRIVPQIYAVKASEVKETFQGGIKKPTYSNLQASITSRGHSLSLAHFPHSPLAPRGKKYKVRATIKKAKGRQVVKTTPSPFVMTTGALSVDKVQYNIFKRDGKKRTPVTVLRTLSIPQMINNEGVEEKLQAFAQQKLGERLEHEIVRSMTSIGAKLR